MTFSKHSIVTSIRQCLPTRNYSLHKNTRLPRAQATRLLLSTVTLLGTWEVVALRPMIKTWTPPIQELAQQAPHSRLQPLAAFKLLSTHNGDFQTHVDFFSFLVKFVEIKFLGSLLETNEEFLGT